MRGIAKKEMGFAVEDEEDGGGILV